MFLILLVWITFNYTDPLLQRQSLYRYHNTETGIMWLLYFLNIHRKNTFSVNVVDRNDAYLNDCLSPDNFKKVSQTSSSLSVECTPVCPRKNNGLG
jgi:hypothetical protein